MSFMSTITNTQQRPKAVVVPVCVMVQATAGTEKRHNGAEAPDPRAGGSM